MLFGISRYRKSSKKNASTSTKAPAVVASKPSPKKRKRKEPTLGEIQEKLREEKRVRLQQRRPAVPAPVSQTPSTAKNDVPNSKVPTSTTSTNDLDFAPLDGLNNFPNFVQLNADGSPEQSPFSDGLPVSKTAASPVVVEDKLPDLLDLEKAFSSIQPISDTTPIDPVTAAGTDYVLGTPSSPLKETPRPAPIAFAVDPVEIEVLRTPLHQDVSPIDVVPVDIATNDPSKMGSSFVNDSSDVHTGWWSKIRARWSNKDDIVLDIEGSRTDIEKPLTSTALTDTSTTLSAMVDKKIDTPQSTFVPPPLDPSIIRENVSPEVQQLIDGFILQHEQKDIVPEEHEEVAVFSTELNNDQNITIEEPSPDVIPAGAAAVVEIAIEEPVEIELPWELEMGLHLDYAKPTKRLTSQLRKTQYSLNYEPRDVWYIVGHQYRLHYATSFGLWTERDVQIQYMIQGKNNMWLSTICLDTQRHYFVDISRVVQAWDLTDSVLVYSGIRSDLITSEREQWWTERTMGVTKELLRLTRDELVESITAIKQPIEIEKKKFDWRFWKKVSKPKPMSVATEPGYDEPILDLDVGPTALMRYQAGLSKNVSWNALALCLRWIASHYPSALNHSGTYVLEMLHRLHDGHHIEMTDWLNLRVDEEAFVQCVDYLMRVNYGVGHVLLVASINLHAAQEAWAVHHKDNIGALDLHHDSMWYIEQRFWEHYQKSPI